MKILWYLLAVALCPAGASAQRISTADSPTRTINAATDASEYGQSFIALNRGLSSVSVWFYGGSHLGAPYETDFFNLLQIKGPLYVTEDGDTVHRLLFSAVILDLTRFRGRLTRSIFGAEVVHGIEQEGWTPRAPRV